MKARSGSQTTEVSDGRLLWTAVRIYSGDSFIEPLNSSVSCSMADAPKAKPGRRETRRPSDPR